MSKFTPGPSKLCFLCSRGRNIYSEPEGPLLGSLDLKKPLSLRESQNNSLGRTELNVPLLNHKYSPFCNSEQSEGKNAKLAFAFTQI